MTEKAPERFLVKFVGGPYHGDRITDETKISWPLPDSITIIEYNGTYRKISESDLPPQPGNENHVVRGAQYEWYVES